MIRARARHALGAAALALAVAATIARADCGPTPGPCLIDGGEYHAALPESPQGAPIVVFLHGAGGSGGTTIGNARLVGDLTARGHAVLAPTGSRSFRDRGFSWNFYPGWDGRDEAAFLQQVTADAAARFGLQGDRVLLAGFSAGGFMVTYLACAAPDTFTAYAPVAGGFWQPHPESCTGPVRLFHTHGWADTTVPLEGRMLGGGRFLQGDIFAGLALLRQANGCADPKPSRMDEAGAFLRRAWTGCAPGAALELALFPGGHTVPPGWAGMVLTWFDTVAPPPG
jgi:polyhydroxybutyrate depolymerase